jgi:hypothetical protein
MLRFRTQLIDSYTTGISNMLVACDDALSGYVYLYDLQREKLEKLQSLQYSAGTHNVSVDVRGAPVYRLPYKEHWFSGEGTDFNYVTDMSLGSDGSRMYFLSVANSENGVYDTKISCIDLYEREQDQLKTFAYLPTLDPYKFPIKEYMDIRTIQEAAEYIPKYGPSSVSASLSYELLRSTSMICSYMGRVYVLVSVIMYPYLLQVPILYVLDEATSELIGIGILGGVTPFLKFDYIQPLKNNIAVMDDTLIFRLMRTPRTHTNWYKDLTKYNELWDLNPQSNMLFYLQDDPELVDFLRQPYTLSHYDVIKLEVDLAGSNIQHPVLLECESFFNSQVLGNTAFSKVSVSHDFHKMYGTTASRLHEYQVDGLLIEILQNDRWIPVDSFFYPFMHSNMDVVQVRLTNGFMHTEIREITFTSTTDYIFSPDLIPILAPQQSVIVEVTFSVPISGTGLPVGTPMTYAYANYQ